MIGFHIQNSPPDWPRAVSKLPAAAPVKFCTGVERSSEAWEANPDCRTWYRWVGPQPLPAADYEAHARAWLNNFIDGTFRREAGFVDYTQEYNETLANSQSAEEKARWIALHTAMAKVWYEEYRQEEELSHIKLILCDTAIGNDIPIEIALAAVKYDALLGYHPYQVCRVGYVEDRAMRSSFAKIPVRHDAPRASFRDGGLYKMNTTATFRSKHAAFAIPQSEGSEAAEIPIPNFVSPHDWRWYSGRWAFMDAEFAAQDVRPTWAFGEMGPVLDASPDWSGWLDPMGGWKHKDCLNRDFDKYLQVQKYWLDNVMQTPAYQEGRILGGTLFTSGAPGSGPDWSNFDLQQPEMDRLADFVRTYDYTPTQPPIDPPPPPIDPPPPPTDDNLLVNPSFEFGWTDISGQAQQPNGWTLDLAANGVDVRGRPVKGQPECTHKDKELLPPDEWPDAENALILDGEWTYKLHHGGTTWKAELSQTVEAEPGSKQRLVVPVNIHFDERPDPYDPEDTLVRIDAGAYHAYAWMTKEKDRKWQYISFDFVVPNNGKIFVQIVISVKWEHPTSIFMDDLILEPIEEPQPPDPCPGRPRIDYKRTFHVLPYPATFSQLQQVTAEAYPNRQTVGFSYDDAGIGDLTNKTAILWGIAETDKTRFLAWYKEHYPGTRVLFADFEEPGIFVDVSRHQGDIDWRQMKAQGVTHCYIRASRGSSVEDRKYQENAAGCREAGIRFGAYHFFSYSTKGMAQGEFFYECIKEDPGDLPPAIDFENTGQIAEPDPFQLRNCLSTVESLTGRVPVIYTNLDSWYGLPRPQAWAARYPLWVACWTHHDKPDFPIDWDTWWLWQYVQTDGEPFGVESMELDVNRMNNGS